MNTPRWFWKRAAETIANMRGYPEIVVDDPRAVWSAPRVYELLFLPAPPPVLLLAPPRDIRIGSFVRFKKSALAQYWGCNNQHWAKRYGNGVGIVRRIHDWGAKRKTTVAVDFPHRLEVHYLEEVELAHDATRAMSMLKWGPMYGPEIRLAAPSQAA